MRRPRRHNPCANRRALYHTPRLCKPRCASLHPLQPVPDLQRLHRLDRQNGISDALAHPRNNGTRHAALLLGRLHQPCLRLGSQVAGSIEKLVHLFKFARYYANGRHVFRVFPNLLRLVLAKRRLKKHLGVSSHATKRCRDEIKHKRCQRECLLTNIGILCGPIDDLLKWIALILRLWRLASRFLPPFFSAIIYLC